MGNPALWDSLVALFIGVVVLPLAAVLTAVAAVAELACGALALCCGARRTVRGAPRDPAVVLITGASSGIGEALAHHYARPGRTLLLTGRRADALNATVAACQAKGATVRALQNDVGTQAGRDALAAWLRTQPAQTPLDLAIANAGVDEKTCGAQNKADLAETARNVFAVNVDGAIGTILAPIEAMRARGAGQVCIVSSLSAFGPLSGAEAYAASKACVKSFCESLRWRLAREGVAVNVACPGYVETALTRAQTGISMSGMIGADAAAAAIARGLANDDPVIVFPTGTFLMAYLSSVLPPVVRDFVARNRIFGGGVGYWKSKGASKAASKSS